MNLLRYYEENGKLVEISIDDVEAYLANQNSTDLAEFVYKRFYYRYIKPFEYRSSTMIRSAASGKKVNKYSLLFKNGFSVMANSCLLIEALETFYRGWINSKNKSELAFLKFFSRDKNFREFADEDMPTIFYEHIRCGILHQGEITGGWKISRDDDEDLLDMANKEINATKFIGNLKISLSNYREELNKAGWNDEIWKAARNKIKSIIKSSK